MLSTGEMLNSRRCGGGVDLEALRTAAGGLVKVLLTLQSTLLLLGFRSTAPSIDRGRA